MHNCTSEKASPSQLWQHNDDDGDGATGYDNDDDGDGCLRWQRQHSQLRGGGALRGGGGAFYTQQSNNEGWERAETGDDNAGYGDDAAFDDNVDNVNDPHKMPNFI